MEYIYLDNGATTFPKAPTVGQAMYDVIMTNTVNGLDNKLAIPKIALDIKIEETRKRLAQMFNFDFWQNVIFTSCATMSINTILKGLLHENDHIITSSMDHNAVIRPLAQLKAQGVAYSVALCDHQGHLILENFEKALQDNTKAIIVTHASNVCGTLLDIAALGQFCHEKGLIFILDAAQTAGRWPIDMKAFHIDILVFTGHKALLGPQGIGGFLLNPKYELAIKPLIAGGTDHFSDGDQMPDMMPDRFEAGNQNVPGIIGLSAALDFIEQQGMASLLAHEKNLALLFLKEVSQIKGIKHIGASDLQHSCPIVALDFETVDNDSVCCQLKNDFQIIARCGLNGAHLAHKTLHSYPEGVVRFSFGYDNTIEDVMKCVQAIKQIVNDSNKVKEV